MVLQDALLKAWAQGGGVSPFADFTLNPASMDLRLGDTIRRPHPVWRNMSIETMQHLIDINLIEAVPKWGEATKFSIEWLLPGDFVLCHSLEVINLPDDVIALLFSKSSVGRIGLEHLHAGLGDPGWHNSQWTWELKNVALWPIKLVAGNRIMQQVLIRLVATPDKSYAQTGRYNGDIGPVPAKPEPFGVAS